TGPGGSDDETKTGYITVNAPAPVAVFSATPLSGTAPLTVTFSDTSTGTITTRTWAYKLTSDTTWTTFTLTGSTYTFTTPGTYDLRLTVTGPGGSDDETKTGYITVNDTTLPGQVTGLVNTTYLYNSITWIWTDPDDADLAYVTIYLDGVYQTTVPAGIETYTTSGLQPDTEYTLGITTVDTSGNENTDMVTYSARTAYQPTLGDAVDNTGLAWTTGGSANWFPETTQSYYDGDAAQSGAIGNSQSTYLQTTVTGPGTLTFWWKVSSQTRDYLRFYVDGTLQASIQGEVAWQQKTYSIAEGTHTLKWEYVKDRSTVAGSDCGWVDWVVFTPAGDTTPPGPVTGLANTTYEQTSITWTWTDPIDADLDYVNVFLDGAPVGIVQDGVQTYTATGLTPATAYTLGVTTVDTSGNENIATVTDSATTAPTLDTTPPGPVTGLVNTTYEQTAITWTWTDPIDADLNYVNVFLDGAPVGIVQDGVQTYTATGLTPATAYTLGVTTVDTSGNENTATVTDSATTAPSSGTPTLGDAVDNTGLAWTTGGSANWFPETTQSYYDGDAAQSGAIGNSQSTYLQTTVTGPGTLTFWWKVSSQTRDYLRFYVDGTLQASMQGEVAWQQKTYSIAEGTHTLKWEYVKDRLASAGSDCGWVDWVVFTSAGDITPPGPVTGLANTTYEQTSITWTWTDPPDADLDYVNVFLDGAPVGIVQNGVQTYTATGLTPATSYTLGVTTVDTSGNENTAMVTDGATTAPTLDTTPPGPVTGLANTTYEQTSITWTWTDPIDADLDYVNVFLDGAPVGIVQNGVQTYTATGLTPATAYTLGVTTVDTSGNENTATVTDSATTAPSSGTPTLGDAVDNTGLAWTTGGSANWFPETTQSYYDGDAAQSGAIGNSQSTYLQTTVTGPGTLTFWWKVSSQTRDPLTFSIDGMSRASVKGEVAWQQKTYSITEGTHVLKWEYVKDRAYSAGSDAGWVDKVTFSSPSSPLPKDKIRPPHTALPLQIIRSFVSWFPRPGQFPA
ncbi:MAG TPA: PKD domain-containing protein, partial [Methanoregulaceae archaeon]|nr:PKD domain-containing protein [Methanoregulaceae archaeon]